MAELLMETVYASSASWARRMASAQARWSARLDAWLPAAFRTDGNQEFLQRIVPRHLQAGALVYDVGGGKNPVIASECKRRLRLKVAGIDISANELAAAPEGSYDHLICADITRYRGAADGDLVICQALLEHVTDTKRALAGIAGLLKPGGRALIFLPSRNAVYARMNRMLPERFKQRLLAAVFPETSGDHGFPACYDRCTPLGIERSAAACGLRREQRHLYFRSDYFRLCFPLHVLWRAWLLLYRMAAGAEAAETFTFVFRKEA